MVRSMANNLNPPIPTCMPSTKICSLCHHICQSNTAYAIHVLARHKNEGNFYVSCMHPSCKYTTNSWHNFNQHCRRQHKQKSFSYTIEDRNGAVETILEVVSAECSDPIPEQMPSQTKVQTPKIPLPAAKFMLNMESAHQLTRCGSQDVTDTLALLVNNILKDVQTNFNILNVNNQGQSEHALAEAIKLSRPNEWCNLNSVHKRRKLYERNFKYIPPQSVYLGKALKSVRCSKRRCVRNQYGYIVPLAKLIEFLLHIPDIWHFVNTSHQTEGIMGDFVDGSYVKKIDCNPDGKAFISLLLSYDDVEIQNPLRSNKLHKLAMFYVTLANIPPQYRSKLRAIFPIAIAKTIDLKKNGLNNLLNDFVSTVADLKKGLQLKVHSTDVTVKGDLIAAMCDTPAAALLGGFKESSSFAWKSCRMCTADQDSSREHFTESKFDLRDMKSYLEQCDILEDSNILRNRDYWSKHFGVNRRSVLTQIPEFPVTANLIQDPMHVILEGIFPYVTALMLKKIIYAQKYFTLDKLNTEVQNFEYSHLDKTNCPPLIEKQHVVKNSHIKMKAASALSMIYIFPFILAGLVPDGDLLYDHFLMLVRISLLVFSPFCDSTTAGVLSGLIDTFCRKFKVLYPGETIKPKFHFLVHLPSQILKFGPLRHQSTLRFEGKHVFFKDHRWRNFNNLPLSLLTKHQLYLSNITTNDDGTLKNEFLRTSGIIAKLGMRTLGKGLHYALPCENTMYTKIGSYTRNGREYRDGLSILMKDEEYSNPVFAVICGMYATDAKVVHFVLERYSTVDFSIRHNAFQITNTGRFDCILLDKMTWPLPLPVYFVDGEAFITNRYSAYNPFL